jgi:predicted tellurium resistance membrane protein TerC
MASASYLIIIALFLIYYLAIAYFEKKFISDPREVIEKFLAVVLGYAGISLIYFSLTGEPLFTDSISEYFIYIFIIGFIAVLWAVPTLLMEFKFFQKFSRMRDKKGKKKVARKK